MTDENKDQPKPAAPPAEKAAAPEYVPLADNPILKGLAEHLPGACSAGWDYLGQWIFDVDKNRVPEIGRWLKESQRFDMCADVTAVDWKDRPKRFTMVYNLYSLQDNRRILLRAEVADGEDVPTISGIWSMAAWPEREVFDMFGIRFEGHPDLRRILMPEDWAGHPLRKDYDLRGRNPEWISRHLVIRETGETAAAPNAPASEAAHE